MFDLLFRKSGRVRRNADLATVVIPAPTTPYSFPQDEVVVTKLRDGGYITDEQIASATPEERNPGEDIFGFLMRTGAVTRDMVGQALAESYHLPYADLNSNVPSVEQVLKIPIDIAQAWRVVLFKDTETDITVSTDMPRPGLQAAMELLFPGKRITIAFSAPDDINDAMVLARPPLTARISEIEKKGGTAPDFLNAIFDDAIALHASDVHLEPRIDAVAVRLRVDNVLRDAGSVKTEAYPSMLNRLKVKALMRVDEHMAAQDGSMQYENGSKTYDMRVSIIPTVTGEKVAIRILSEYVQSLALSTLGLSNDDQELLLSEARKPFGMILVSGPTGSGKTTTLYALLKLLNHSTIQVVTIEDPVEYKIVGVNQIQVNAQTDLTFVKGLRSIVRQDPNVILVGEIRDNETADIAVNAALTGHVLLSTFHANDAASSIPRLLSMGVEPFLLSSSLNLIISQRLLRRVCESCRYSYQEKIKDLSVLVPKAKHYFDGATVTLYKGKGCSSCGGTGYKGRIALYEMLRVTSDIKEAILQHSTAAQIWSLAKSHGARSMFDDGIEKVKVGITTIEELLRVVVPEE